jgi:hypothetical protein
MGAKNSKIDSTRLYLRTPDAKYARLLWMRNNKPNEMLLGFYGLAGGPATITHELPEQIIPPGAPVRFEYKDATKVCIELDHFSCHADGRFHLKRRTGNTPVYSHDERHTEPLGPNTGVFIDLIVFSHTVDTYKTIEEEPKSPHVWISTAAGNSTMGRCLFAGANYAIAEHALSFADGNRTTAIVTLTSSTLKGAVIASPWRISQEARAALSGTLVAFTWSRGEAGMGLKPFILS